MEQLGIFLRLGLEHVLDPGAYDHVLFLATLAAPYALSDWKRVVWLATVFTVAHCTSLALSAFDWVRVEPAWIEFLIPVTIAATALHNIWSVYRGRGGYNAFAFAGTALFGLVHGFGFSNYFNTMVFGLEEKLLPLFGFALGIELAQVVVIMGVLLISAAVFRLPRWQKKWWVYGVSGLVLLISLPLLAETWNALRETT